MSSTPSTNDFSPEDIGRAIIKTRKRRLTIIQFSALILTVICIVSSGILFVTSSRERTDFYAAKNSVKQSLIICNQSFDDAQSLIERAQKISGLSSSATLSSLSKSAQDMKAVLGNVPREYSNLPILTVDSIAVDRLKSFNSSLSMRNEILNKAISEGNAAISASSFSEQLASLKQALVDASRIYTNSNGKVLDKTNRDKLGDVIRNAQNSIDASSSLEVKDSSAITALHQIFEQLNVCLARVQSDVEKYTKLKGDSDKKSRVTTLKQQLTPSKGEIPAGLFGTWSNGASSFTLDATSISGIHVLASTDYSGKDPLATDWTYVTTIDITSDNDETWVLCVLVNFDQFDLIDQTVLDVTDKNGTDVGIFTKQ